MVRLTRIYTKVGDKGTTMLGDGSVTPKTSPRVEAYGTVDEANATIGIVVSVLSLASAGGAADHIRDSLVRIQNDLFDLGADLSTPAQPDEPPGTRLRVRPEQTAYLERLIDHYNASLEPLNSFVLPGGSPVAAHLHVARTTVRRAERRVAALLEAEPSGTNSEALVFLNRLSDLLFVMGRFLNDCGKRDVLWVPGANRTADPTI